MFWIWRQTVLLASSVIDPWKGEDSADCGGGSTRPKRRELPALALHRPYGDEIKTRMETIREIGFLAPAVIVACGDHIRPKRRDGRTIVIWTWLCG